MTEKEMFDAFNAWYSTRWLDDSGRLFTRRELREAFYAAPQVRPQSGDPRRPQHHAVESTTADREPAAAAPSNTPGHAEALAKIDKALQHVFAICKGDERWTMRIPARPDTDSDLIICDALETARKLLAVPSETAPLADALAGLLAHCDYTSDCETDYEKAVHAGRAALNAYIKSVTK